MRSSSLYLCLLLVCIYQTAYSGRRLRPRILLEGDGINFPRRTLSKTQAANCVFNKRWFTIYVISNPSFGPDNARDLEVLFKPRGDGSLDDYWDARFEGVCVSDVWLFEPVAGEGNRAVYTFDGPFPSTGEAVTISFFSSHPRDYIFIFWCLDRNKEIVRNGKRVYCDGPFSITFLTNQFPPNQVKWSAAERDLRKAFGLTFDHELNIFNPTLERCNQEPLPT